MLQKELEEEVSYSSHSTLDPIKKNDTKRSKVESAVIKREQLMEQLKKLENKLAVAVSIIKFDTIHYQYTSIDTAQLIQQFKLWGLTDREILSKFKISKKEYSHCQKAFEDYFFNRIRG